LINNIDQAVTMMQQPMPSNLHITPFFINQHRSLLRQVSASFAHGIMIVAVVVDTYQGHRYMDLSKVRG